MESTIRPDNVSEIKTWGHSHIEALTTRATEIAASSIPHAGPEKQSPPPDNSTAPAHHTEVPDKGPRNDHAAPDTSAERQLWELYLLVGVLVPQTALMVIGNDSQATPWLLTLLVVGVAQAFILPSSGAAMLGLATVTLLILFRQATGLWTRETVIQGTAEIVGMAVAVFLAIRYAGIWRKLQHELGELRGLRQLLVGGEIGTGLLPLQVAELRLIEEVDRARQFHRPLGLLLIDMEPLQDHPSSVDSGVLYQALARQLAGAAFVHDIPFRSGPHRLGLILVERDWAALYRSADLISDAMKQATILGPGDQPKPVSHYVKLIPGLGIYSGEDSGDIDLMRAAEDSLNISRELSELGETSVTAYAMPAVPIEEVRTAIADEEE